MARTGLQTRDSRGAVTRASGIQGPYPMAAPGHRGWQITSWLPSAGRALSSGLQSAPGVPPEPGRGRTERGLLWSMHVQILTMTPEPMRVLWTAARTCYSAQTPHDLWKSAPSKEEMLRLIRHIWKSGHHSVLEHVAITYAVSGVSRALLAQITRHRIGVSFSVQSQRHVRVRGQLDTVTPWSIAGREEAFTEFQNFLASVMRVYERLIQLGVPKEDARFVLPNAAATNFVMTVNLRSLWDLFQKRVVEPGAQWEIVDLVTTMVDLVTYKEPWLHEFFSKDN